MKYFPIEQLPEFDDHKMVSFISDSSTGLRGFIAVHRGDLRRPSFGATRFWKYASEGEALRDALRLSRIMSYKLALANLPYGGAKCVLIAPRKNHVEKQSLLKSYAERVNYLSGRFITGTDVGLDDDDLAVMRRHSQYMVGAKGDVVRFTGLGVFYGIQVSLKEVFGGDDTSKFSFAIQGVGKVGEALLRLLYKKSKRIVIADVNKKRVAEAKKEFPQIEVVPPSKICTQEVDVFCPCALGGTLNKKTAPLLRCRIVAGGANNQLENGRAGDMLREQGVLYAPDYAVNAGGLICVVDEYEHSTYSAKRVASRVLQIKKNLQQIFRTAKKTGKAPGRVADEIAEKRFNGS